MTAYNNVYVIRKYQTMKRIMNKICITLPSLNVLLDDNDLTKAVSDMFISVAICCINISVRP